MQFVIEHLWYVIGGGTFLLVGGVLLLIYTGTLHRLMDWMKPDSDKFIKAQVFCEDNQIRNRKLKVERYCVSDVKKHRSYHLVHELLIQGGNGQYLALSERNSRPIDFLGKMTPEKWSKLPSAQRVFLDTTADIRSDASQESASNFMGMSLSIIALCGTLVFVVMAIIIFWQSRGS